MRLYKPCLIAAGSVLVLVSLYGDLELRTVYMAQLANKTRLSILVSLQGQLGNTFLSSKHLDYMAATAEISRP